jgi:hypothetical protein
MRARLSLVFAIILLNKPMEFRILIGLVQNLDLFFNHFYSTARAFEIPTHTGYKRFYAISEIFNFRDCGIK